MGVNSPESMVNEDPENFSMCAHAFEGTKNLQYQCHLHTSMCHSTYKYEG